MLPQADWPGMARPSPSPSPPDHGLTTPTMDRESSRIQAAPYSISGHDGRENFRQEVRYYKGPRFSHPALTPELGSQIGEGTFDRGQKSCKIVDPLTYSQARVVRWGKTRGQTSQRIMPPSPTLLRGVWGWGPQVPNTENAGRPGLISRPEFGGDSQVGRQGSRKNLPFSRLPNLCQGEQGTRREQRP